MKTLFRCLSYIALACALIVTAIDPLAAIVIGIIALFLLILGLQPKQSKS